MSTIKVKRTTGSTPPTGLTFGEPAFVDGLNSFYVTKDNGTSVRVGAEVDTNATLGGGSASDNKIPTQKAVYDYVDAAIVAGGGGFTLAASSGTPQTITTGSDTLTIAAGAGISTVAGATDTVTVYNTGVLGLTLAATGNKGLQTVFEIGFAGPTGYVNAGIGIDFSNLTLVTPTTLDLVVIGDQSDSNNPKDGTVGAILDIINGDVNVDSSGTSSIGSGVIVDADISAVAAISVSKLASATISGITLGGNLNALTIGDGLGGAASYNGSTAVTITNQGVRSITGTTNEIEVSGATGDITIGLPDNVTIGGNLSVVGNLTINGTTTTVNSTTVAIQDPIFTLGGTAALSGPTDSKDRGIEFRWYDSDILNAPQTGFFGFDDSNGNLIYIPQATNTSEVFSGTLGTIQAGSFSFKSSTSSTYSANTTTETLSGDRTYVLPNHSGRVVVPSDLGTSGYILKANGATSQPTWINANAAGFTAYAAGRLETARTIGLTGDVSGSASFDGTTDINITTTIAPNSIALGTDTTGNYAADVSVSGIGLSITGSPGEGVSFVVISGATSSNTVSQIVARDSSGNFSAGTITANLTGTASTATNLAGGDAGQIAYQSGAGSTTFLPTSATAGAVVASTGAGTAPEYKVISLTNGSVTSGSGTLTLAVQDAVADGSTKGLPAFNVINFEAASGVISIDTVDGGSY